MSKEPTSYTTLYTCVACKQISTYKKPSTLDVQETVQDYTDLLQKLVKYEHKEGTKRILFELAEFMERIQRYLNTEKKKELDFQNREQIFAGNPFHDQIKGYLQSKDDCNHFQTCLQGLTKSPLQGNLQVNIQPNKFREISLEATVYADDIIVARK